MDSDKGKTGNQNSVVGARNSEKRNIYNTGRYLNHNEDHFWEKRLQLCR